MLVKEFTAVVFVTGIMLFLYLDLVGKLDTKAQSAREHASKDQEKRLTMDERLIMLRYLIKDHLLLHCKLVIYRKGSLMHLVKTVFSAKWLKSGILYKMNER